MAQKKEVQVKDLKPKKDAKGGVGARQQTNTSRSQTNRGTHQADSSRGNANGATRGLL